MATTKIATLIIRTLAKPISLRIKEQARQHDRFRSVCMSLAQFMYRTEVKLRTNILGENIAGQGRHIRPLSEAKAIENGANLLAEGFLFAVAAGLIVGETWRSSRKEGRRREGVDDQLDELNERLAQLEGLLEEVKEDGRVQLGRANDLARILERVVEISIRGGSQEVDPNFPCPVRESSSSEAESTSSLPLRTAASMPTSAAGVLGSLPDPSEKFTVNDLGPTVETLDRTGVSEGKRP